MVYQEAHQLAMAVFEVAEHFRVFDRWSLASASNSQSGAAHAGGIRGG